MGPNAQSGIDYQALRSALLARLGQGGQATPTLGQTSTPVGANPLSGGMPTQTPGTPQQMQPGAAQPKFSSPFAGPKVAPGSNLDDETKKIAKLLVGKLLQVL